MKHQSCWCLIIILLITRNITSQSVKQFHLKDIKNDDNESTSSNEPHSRQKRLIWVTNDGRLALPPGTTLIIAPTLSMPLVRYPPDGFHSNISVSVPLTSELLHKNLFDSRSLMKNISLTVDFDKLGLTDNENPLGTLGPLFARSMSNTAGSVLADYIYKYLKHRKRRDVNQFSNEFIKMEHLNEIPQLPNEHKHAFHGGERALLYTVLEDFLSSFGLDGHACVLRAICEVHSKQVHRYGLIGEFLKLFFT